MVARKYLPKWELTHTSIEGKTIVKKYFSISDIKKDHSDLDRQVIYRIRKGMYLPTNYKGNTNKAFEKYSRFSIQELTGYKIFIHREIIRDVKDDDIQEH